MSALGVSADPSMRELFAREGVDYINKSDVSKAANELWRFFYSSHEKRVQHDRAVGWSKLERKQIKKLHPETVCSEACICAEMINIREDAGKIEVFAKKNLPKGTILGVYAGEIMTTTEATALGAENPYLITASEFPTEEQILINAARKGNWTRYIGHSLVPNLEAWVASGGNAPQMVFKAVRSIAEGDKLVMNCGLTYSEKFRPPEEGLRASVVEKKRKSKELSSEIGSPLSRKKITRWNDPQFLMASAYAAIASSKVIEERKAHLSRVINEQRVLNGCTEMLTDEEVFREFCANRLDWQLREQRRELGWV